MTTTSRPVSGSARRTVRTMCPMNCHPTYCGMVVEVEGDRLVSIRGDKDNPDSHGFLCIRGRSAGEILDNPDRILVPRMRVPGAEYRVPGANDARPRTQHAARSTQHSARGTRHWNDVSWDEALDRIAGAIRAAGPEATAVWAGHGVFVNGLGGQFSARFANMTGAQWWNPSIVCWGLGGFGFSLTGITEVNSMDDMAEHAELIVLWGANLTSQPNSAPRIVAARKRGARVLAIDIRHTEAFEQADETYLIRPGTDAALALAMMHVIIGEGLADRSFVECYTLGFDELAEHVRQFTPEWAEAETGIAAERIRGLAHSFAATRQSMIMAGGSSMHKSGNGWQAARAIACLPALTGSLGAPGAGMGPRHAAQSHGMGMNRIVPPREQGSREQGTGNREQGETEIISEMSTILDALDAGRVKVLILLGTNMLSSFADSNRVARALERMDLVVSFDLFMNETSRGYADIVLPGTSWLEETGFKTTNTHLYLMDQVLPPAGESRPTWWVLDQIATRLGVTEFFPWQSPDGALDAIFDHDATNHATVAALRAGEGHVPLAVSPVAHPEKRFATPSGRVEFVSERAEQLGLPALPVYERPRENGPDAPQAGRYPLVFVQGRAITHFHGFYDHGRALPSLAHADPEPRLWINPADAAVRDLADGAPVRIANDRGEMAASAHVTDRVPPGVVWMHDGWDGINRLTSGARSVPDAAARVFPSGSAAYEARVEVSAV
jgi:anaerobic selenocysteine-containing dehydrogenase